MRSLRGRGSRLQSRAYATCYATLSHALALRCSVLGSFEEQGQRPFACVGPMGLGQISRSPGKGNEV